MQATALERRVAALERRNRIVTTGLVTLLALAGLSASVRQAGVPDELRARRIVMVDGEGRVRAELAVDEEGSAGLFVRDAEGRRRAMVVHDPAQAALYLLDEEGTVRLGSALFAHGGVGHALHGPGAKGAAVLYLKDEGSLTFYGEDGQVLERIAPQ